MTEELDLPFWIKQRQATVEAVGQGEYRVSGPNLPEAVIGVKMTDALRWQGYLRANADAPDHAAVTATQGTARDALHAAFELYREHMIY
jgi:hypothetical protein